MQLNLYSMKRTQQMIKSGTICGCLMYHILYWSHSPYVKERNVKEQVGEGGRNYLSNSSVQNSLFIRSYQSWSFRFQTNNLTSTKMILFLSCLLHFVVISWSSNQHRFVSKLIVQFLNFNLIIILCCNHNCVSGLLKSEKSKEKGKQFLWHRLLRQQIFETVFLINVIGDQKFLQKVDNCLRKCFACCTRPNCVSVFQIEVVELRI